MRQPECNYCGNKYDPLVRHTCAGNDIWPVGRREDAFDHPAADGLTREKIGLALDAERAARNREERDDMLDATTSQIGGDHYRKLPIQPVEYIIANGIGFLAGNIIKYATRYKDKGGAEDIRKIKHYCELILEFEYKEQL